eukprot:ANDGO_06034.mRNA.1 Cilia- and flagella-associated protein 43
MHPHISISSAPSQNPVLVTTRAYACPQSPSLAWLNKNTVAYPAGSGVLIYDYSTGYQQLWSPVLSTPQTAPPLTLRTAPVGCITYNATLDILAVEVISSPTQILLFRGSDRAFLGSTRLPAKAAVAISDMAFSADGGRFVVLGSVPRHAVVLFRVVPQLAKDSLVLEGASLSVLAVDDRHFRGTPVDRISFCPVDRNILFACGGSSGSGWLIRYDPSGILYSIVNDDEEDEKNSRVTAFENAHLHDVRVHADGLDDADDDEDVEENDILNDPSLHSEVPGDAGLLDAWEQMLNHGDMPVAEGSLDNSGTAEFNADLVSDARQVERSLRTSMLHGFSALVCRRMRLRSDDLDPREESKKIVFTPSHCWIEGARVVVGSVDGHVIVVDARTMSAELVCHFDSRVVGVFASKSLQQNVDDNVMYVLTADGVLRVFSRINPDIFATYAVVDDKRLDGNARSEVIQYQWFLSQPGIYSAPASSIVLTATGQLLALDLSRVSPSHSNLKSNSQELSPQLLGDFHRGPITSVSVIPSGMAPVMVSSGQDATIRVWDWRSNQLALIVRINDVPTCVHATEDGAYLVAGTASGHLIVFRVDRSTNVSLTEVYHRKVATSPIHTISSSLFQSAGQSGKLHAVVALSSDNFSVLSSLVVGTSVRFSLLGSTPLSGFPTDIAFVPLPNNATPDASELNFYVALRSSHLYLYTFPQAPFLQLKHACFWKFDFAALSLAALNVARPSAETGVSIGGYPWFLSGASDIMTIAEDRAMRVYRMKIPTPDDPSDVLLTADFVSAAAHGKIGSSLIAVPQISQDGLPDLLFATAATDGTVAIWDMDSAFAEWGSNSPYAPSPAKDSSLRFSSSLNSLVLVRASIHSSLSGGVRSLAADRRSATVYTCGADGAIVVSSVVAPSMANTTWPVLKFTSTDESLSVSVAVSESSEVSNSSNASSDLQSAAPGMSAVAMDEDLRESVLKDLDYLREQLQDLVLKNRAAPEDEKLLRGEFLIDEGMVKKLENDFKVSSDELRKKARESELSSELLLRRIRDECVAPMDTRGQSLVALSSTSTFSVVNYPIMKKSERQKRAGDVRVSLSKIRNLRLVEVEEFRRSNRTSVSQIINVVSPQTASAVAKIYEKHPLFDGGFISPASANPLAYHPIDVYTQFRKRVQYRLLREEIDAEKEKFNVDFKGTLEKKLSEMGKIAERIDRMRDISRELGKGSVVVDLGKDFISNSATSEGAQISVGFLSAVLSIMTQVAASRSNPNAPFPVANQLGPIIQQIVQKQKMLFVRSYDPARDDAPETVSSKYLAKKPELHDAEVPDRLLTLTEEEKKDLTRRRAVFEEDYADVKREQAEEQQRKAELQLAENEGAMNAMEDQLNIDRQRMEKALVQMMDGQLERPAPSELERVPEKSTVVEAIEKKLLNFWTMLAANTKEPGSIRMMSLMPANMLDPEASKNGDPIFLSDDEIVQWKVYETLVLKIREEQDKYRRSLEGEFKKLEEEIEQVSAAFDAQLVALGDRKRECDQRVAKAEYSLIQLAKAALFAREVSVQEGLLSDSLARLRRNRLDISNKVRIIEFRRDVCRRIIDVVAEQERGLERSTRSRLASMQLADDRAIDSLIKLFRKKLAHNFDETEKTLLEEFFALEWDLLEHEQIQQQQQQQQAAGVAPPSAPAVAGGDAGNVEDIRDDEERRLMDRSEQRSTLERLICNLDGNGFVHFIQRTLDLLSPVEMDGAVDEDEEAVIPISDADFALLNRDRPDRVDENLWNEFVVERAKKLRLERRSLILSRLRSALSSMLARWRKLEHAYVHRLEATERAYGEYVRDVLFRDALDADILLQMRQGQVEVDQAAVVTDYVDAILVQTGSVQARNARIRGHGTDKVGLLQQIRELRRGIYTLQWERERLELAAQDISQRIRDVQLLRVTKSMQALIKASANMKSSNGGGGAGKKRQDALTTTLNSLVDNGGDSNSATANVGEQLHAAERVRLERKIDMSKKNAEQKRKEKLASLKQLERQLKRMEEENGVMDDQISTLSVELQERQRIYAAQNLGRETEGLHHRMKLVRGSRKLAELSKAQEVELQALKQELDRLRERTFPSFATVRRRNEMMGNPDERS